LVETDQIQYDKIDSDIKESTLDVIQSDKAEAMDVNKKQINRMLRDAYYRLSPFKKALIGLGIGKWYIGSYKESTWKGKLPFYAWKCHNCGKITFSYPQGHSKYLQCQYCASSRVNITNSI